MILSLLSKIYGIVINVRNYLYDNNYFHIYKSSLPVVCVGNLNVGGNGKTPLVIYLVEQFASLGLKPVVLTRGYKGKQSGPLIVNTDIHSTVDVGDEPTMLARKITVPIVVSRKRAEGARYIEKNKLGNIIILDDGFQHRALARDLDLICAYVGSDKSYTDFINAKLLPEGRFREDKNEAFNRANAVIFTSRSIEKLDSDKIEKLKSEIPDRVKVFSSHLESRSICSLEGQPIENLDKVRCVAFCGLANPEAFFYSLESMGMQVEEKKVFGDHHNYLESELKELQSRSQGRILICSEKDAIKIDSDKFPDIYVLKMGLSVNPEDEFLGFLRRILKINR